MLKIVGNELIFYEDKCIQCAVCVPSCPHDALSSSFSKDKGLYLINIEMQKCTLCDYCVKVCPPNIADTDKVEEAAIDSANGIFLAHANDEDVRFESSTGGVAKALTEDFLRNASVDAVYTLLKTDEEEEEVGGRWITELNSHRDIPNSIYRPVMWGDDLLSYDRSWKTVLIIGLPCQIKGAVELLRRRRPKMVVMTIAIMCRQQKTAKFTSFVKKNMGIPDGERIQYRGDGWPGLMGSAKVKRDYTEANASAFGEKLWTVEGCLFCADCLAANVADITLADPWGIDKDPKGNNLILQWSDRIRISDIKCLSGVVPVKAKDAKISLNFKAIRQKEMEKLILVSNEWSSRYTYIRLRRKLLEKSYEILGDGVVAKVIKKLLPRVTL